MLYSKNSVYLKSEISKLAKLGNIQGGIPPVMRGLPVLAIMAGEAVAQATHGRNFIEERMLGADEAILLGAPPKQLPLTTRGDAARPGVRMMCQRCTEGRTKPGGIEALIHGCSSHIYNPSVMERGSRS